MTRNESNMSYALLALALAVSLLYRPVIAADPDASLTPTVEPGAGAIAEPLRQDFDALISEIEARQPVQDPPPTTAAAPEGTIEDQLNAVQTLVSGIRHGIAPLRGQRSHCNEE
jgi:hypothetical protein